MDKQEFHKDLDKYIKVKRKKEAGPFFSSIFKKRKEKIEPKPEFSEPVSNVVSNAELPKEEVNDDIDEDLPQDELKKEPEKKTFASLMAGLFKKKEMEEEKEDFTKIELYKPQMDKDVKNVLLIADFMIQKVPNFELRKFMQSKEYELYISIMKKYGLK